MNLVAFTGHKYAGKSTAAHELMRLVEYPTRLSFAAPIKRAVIAMGFTNEEVYNGNKEATIAPFNVSMRRLFQTLGTDWGRHMIHPDLWLRMFERQYLMQARSGTELIVVDDVRYNNEADMIKSLGGYIVLIEGTHGAIDAHDSEKGIDEKWITHRLQHKPDLQEFLTDVRTLGLQLGLKK